MRPSHSGTCLTVKVQADSASCASRMTNAPALASDEFGLAQVHDQVVLVIG